MSKNRGNWLDKVKSDTPAVSIVDELTALRAERDALAAEVARLREAKTESDAVEYGDGYVAGMVDGIRDLVNDLNKALESAKVGYRLPALERVIAEYTATYLS